MKNYLFTSLMLLSLWAISGCASSNGTSTTSSSRIYVASLEENWGRLEVESLAWHSDAYLTGVILPIIVDYPRSGQMLINAYYFSVDDHRKMLRISVNESGDISTEISDLVEHLNDPPILREDWEIDSMNVLPLLLNNSDVEVLANNPDTQCSNLTLDKRRTTIEHTTVWRLLVHDCGASGYIRNGYINALNGEQLK